MSTDLEWKVVAIDLHTGRYFVLIEQQTFACCIQILCDWKQSGDPAVCLSIWPQHQELPESLFSG